jgi:hypothetical protein
MNKILILAIGLLSSTFLKAQVPMLLEYDGYLIERGKPVTGNRTIGVKVYNASKSGSVLYNETIGTVTISQGEFYFQYGQNGTTQNGNLKGISGALSGSQLWLALTVNGTEQTPRQRLLAVPFALRSADAQKTDEDLRKLVDGVGRIVVAFGGNSTDLLKNPAGALGTIQKTVADLLEVRKRAEVIPVSSGNLTAESNRIYAATGSMNTAISLPTNPKIGDSVRILGEGATILAPKGAAIIHDWSPLVVNVSGIGELIPFRNPGMFDDFGVLCSENAQVIYMVASEYESPDDTYLVRSIDGGATWSSLAKINSDSQLINCSADGSRLLCKIGTPGNASLRLYTNFGNQTKSLLPPTDYSAEDPIYMSKKANRIFIVSTNATTGLQRLRISQDDGATWKTSNQTISGKTYSLGQNGAYDGTLALSADGNIIVASASHDDDDTNALLLSENGGNSWRKISLPTDPDTGDEINAGSLQISDDGNTIISFPFMLDEYSGLVLSLDRGKTWSRSKMQFASVLNNLPSLEAGKFIGLPNLKKIYAGQLMSSNFGRYWRKANIPESFDTGYDSDSYSMVYVSFDGQRKLIRNENDMMPNFLKSWVDSLISSGSTELVYVGSGNWVARFFENQP